MPPVGDLAHNPGMCPDWESNKWPFGFQASTQSTELPQSDLEEQNFYLKNLYSNYKTNIYLLYNYVQVS